MNKYFIQLFLRENTVILPGFGALTAPNGNVEDIMFLPYLKTDDGKLADFIVETEGIDRQDAQNTIAKFIREMEANLSKGESFDIFQFGSFFKNETGDIEFKSWLKESKKEEAAVETIPETIEKTEETEGIIEPSAFNTDAIEEVKEVITPILTPEPEKLKEIKEEVIKEKEPEVIIAKTPVPIEEEKKKRKGPIWIFSLLLLALIAISIYWFWDKTPKKDLEQKVAQSESKEESTPEDTIKEKVEETKTKPVEPKENIQATSSDVEILSEDSKGFFLIGGYYASQEVAESKAKAAIKEGLDAKLLPFSNGRLYISLANFTDRTEANDALQQLRDKGKKVWILQK